jgi:3-oxoacyl-[acyl-carrier protein] reductase
LHRLSNPVVIITGGAGGLATSLATAFRETGAEVFSPGRDELDVRSSADVDRYFQGFERIDVLINNAGITGDKLFARLEEADWDAVVDTNLKGAFLCAKAAARLMMKQRDGSIIQIGSYSALNPPIGQTAYAASKAGLIGLTKSLAKELGPRNIRVNCVLPGFLETRMTADLSEEARGAALSRHALGRFNTAEDAASFVVTLTRLSHVSGQVFQLDSRV